MPAEDAWHRTVLRPPAPDRARRSNLAVPGSSPKMIDKALTLAADQVFLDLADAVSPIAKEAARASMVAGLREGDWGVRVRVVRVNDWTTRRAYADVVEVVGGAGDQLTPSCCRRCRPPSRSWPWICCSPGSRSRTATRSAASASRPRSRTTSA